MRDITEAKAGAYNAIANGSAKKDIIPFSGCYYSDPGSVTYVLQKRTCKTVR